MSQEQFLSGFATILGRPNVGKSSIMNALIGEKVAIVSPKPQTTRTKLLGVLTQPGCQIVFVDTPGLHTPRTKLGEFMVKAAKDARSGMDILLSVADASDMRSSDIEFLQKLAAGTDARKILLINKIDLTPPQKLMPVLQSLNGIGYDDICPVSAKTGKGMDELLSVMKSVLPPGPKYFPEDMLTDQPERLIVAEMIREKALIHLKEEIPHGIGVEILSFEKISDGLTEINATIYCERASHKSIIIGKQGSMLKLIGQQARLDIERLLYTKVMLKLWIKVRENWRNRADDLNTLGYEDKG